MGTLIDYHASDESTESSGSGQSADIRVAYWGVGDITPRDVTMAHACKGTILAYDVAVHMTARRQAQACCRCCDSNITSIMSSSTFTHLTLSIIIVDNAVSYISFQFRTCR